MFYSFHYVPDNWRVSQVRYIGAVEGNKPASDNDWQAVKKGADRAIQKWIDDQLIGRSCTVVLIGKETANRKWIDYEIEKLKSSWTARRELSVFISITLRTQQVRRRSRAIIRFRGSRRALTRRSFPQLQKPTTHPIPIASTCMSTFPPTSVHRLTKL